MSAEYQEPVEGAPVSIFRTLAILPSGKYSENLTLEEAGKYLQQHYGGQNEKDRNNRHALRDELYRDGGVGYMERFIDDVFDDLTVRKLRKKWVKYARFNNAMKRLVNEMSTVYAEPARRIVGPLGKAPDPGSDPETTQDAENPEDEKYQLVLEAVRMDERMVEVSRLLNLHRALLVGFRVRMKPDGTREPVIDIATPANVRAVMHPNDDTLVIGWMIRTCYKTAKVDLDAPKWTLWTDAESMQLREDLTIIGDSVQPHNLGMMPWVPVTLGPPASGFWPGEEGEDLTAAHIAIWFQNILTLKENKSATKQTIISGDGTAVGRGQAADTETPIELADGQNATTVDMSMDTQQFRDTNDHILQHTAQNYGMSPAIVEHQGVQSAEARELMRMPLREIRRQQQIPLRRFEARFVIVMSVVLGEDLPALKFNPDGWRIEFTESETPLDPINEMTLFERRRAAGLINTIEFIQEKYPGMSIEDAFKRIENNVMIEVYRQAIMRPLAAIQGGMSAVELEAAGVKVSAADMNSGVESGGGAAQRPTVPPGVNPKLTRPIA